MEWECRRATLLLRIFAGLDATQRTCLGALLVSKAKVRLCPLSSSLCLNSAVSRSEPSCQSSLRSGPRVPKGHRKRLPLRCRELPFVFCRAFLHLWLPQRRKLQYFPFLWRSFTNPSTPPLSPLPLTFTPPLSVALVADSAARSALRDKTLQKLLLAATEPFPSDNLYRHASAGGRQQSNEEEEASPIITRSCSCREELKQRLDSKSSLGSYMARVFDTSAVFMVANLWTVRCLLFHLLSTTQLLFDKHHAQVIGTTSGRQRERLQQYLLRESCNTAELLTLLAKYLPLVSHLSSLSLSSMIPLPLPLPAIRSSRDVLKI
jgi:hypothetical protein